MFPYNLLVLAQIIFNRARTLFLQGDARSSTSIYLAKWLNLEFVQDPVNLESLLHTARDIIIPRSSNEHPLRIIVPP